MKKFLFLLLVLLLFGSVAVGAPVWVVDNFEGYADNNALQAAWVMNTSSNIQDETLQNVLNGTCMLIENDSSSPYYAQTKYALPGAVHNDHGVNIIAAGYDTITMTFAIPQKNTGGPWDYLDGSGGNVFLSLYDCWGQKVMGINYSGSVTPSGTGWPNGIVWEIDLADNLISGMNYDNVEEITVGVNSTYYDYGGLFVDDVTFTPEPATLVMLCLGSVLLRKRK